MKLKFFATFFVVSVERLAAKKSRLVTILIPSVRRLVGLLRNSEKKNYAKEEKSLKLHLHYEAAVAQEKILKRNIWLIGS